MTDREKRLEQALNVILCLAIWLAGAVMVMGAGH